MSLFNEKHPGKMNPLLAAKAKEIAEELEMGFRAFIHKKTGELIFVPTEEALFSMDDNPWEKELAILKKQKKSYEEIEKWYSSEAFNMMRDFTDQLTNATELKNRLSFALDNKKPFSNFMAIIHNSGAYRQQWFDYKSNWQQEYVLKQLAHLKL